MENSAYLALPLFAGLAAGDIPAALAALDAGATAISTTNQAVWDM